MSNGLARRHPRRRHSKLTSGSLRLNSLFPAFIIRPRVRIPVLLLQPLSARERENRREQFGAMLDETLASRDLDREFAIGKRTWGLKSPTIMITESTSSGGSV
ncbi:hypothetical protein B0H13DRAFT_2301350 [Mycena leptocephala]|nr:hypothetical protein B0H13DRAFT_2301350 [Mycena leptocephala]